MKVSVALTIVQNSKPFFHVFSSSYKLCIAVYKNCVFFVVFSARLNVISIVPQGRVESITFGGFLIVESLDAVSGNERKLGRAKGKGKCLKKMPETRYQPLESLGKSHKSHGNSEANWTTRENKKDTQFNGANLWEDSSARISPRRRDFLPELNDINNTFV